MTEATYFAYGSNMLPERLLRRCASANLVSAAVVPGFALTFDKIGRDGSGKATLTPSGVRGVAVHGAVFQLSTCDLAALDGIEGSGYGRVADLTAMLPGSAQPLLVTTYVAHVHARDTSLLPFDWYVDLIVCGAEAIGLPYEVLKRMRATPCRTDPIPERPARLEALEILAGVVR